MKKGCIGCLTVLGVIGLISLCGFALVGGVMLNIRNSEPVEQTMTILNNDETAVSLLGSPIELGLFVSGSFETTSASGFADFNMPVSGPNGDGRVFVQAIQSAGQWQVDNLILETENERHILRGSGR